MKQMGTRVYVFSKGSKKKKKKDHPKPKIQAERQEAVAKSRVCSRRDARHMEDIICKEENAGPGRCLLAGVERGKGFLLVHRWSPPVT